MIHGPCGHHNNDSPCMEKNGSTVKTCKKKFPKEVSEVTQTNNNSYPVYRRRLRPDGVIEIGGKQYDNATINQWFIPYNPYFSQKYNCHINLEICSTILAIMYLYKYVYKGSDKTTITAEGVRDEVTGAPLREANEIIRYLSARYISPIEACQRLFEYPIQGKTHTVVKLNVHLPDSQFVTFQATDDPATVLENRRHTKLTRFFELCASEDPENGPAKDMVYQDIPKLFRWDEKKKNWVRYKRYVASVGRLVHCSPNDRERFYLRVLLTCRKGPTSYEDLKTVDGHVCSTFYEAAERAGFLENDKEWDKCLSEASLFHLPYQLRQLFATILVHCQPSKYDDLWEKYYDSLSGDFEHRFREDNDSERKTKFNTLMSLNELLVASGKELANFENLPQLSEFPELIREALMGNNLVERETSYDPQELQQILGDTNLNDTQEAIYKEITEAVQGEQLQHHLFFIDGPGGTGKSTLIKNILAKVRSEGKIALAVASSGIASLLLPGGRTAHSMFKIPLKLNDKSTCNIKKQSNLAALLKQTSIIIWDEAPMSHRFAFEAVDRTLQDIFEIQEPFGGLAVVLSGDFRQILPVIKQGTPADTLNACLKTSLLWNKFKQVRLTLNMRVLGAADSNTAAELEAFAEFLLMVGEGRHEVDPVLGRDMMQIPRDILISNPRYDPAVVQDVETHQLPIPLGLKKIVDAMYSEQDLNNPDAATDHYFADRTILAPTNAAVQSVNEAVANRLRGEQHVYKSTDSVVDASEVMRSAFVETEVLNSNQGQRPSPTQVGTQGRRASDDDSQLERRRGTV